MSCRNTRICPIDIEQAADNVYDDVNTMKDGCMSLYKSLARPLLFRLDAEQAHYLVHWLLRTFSPLLPMAGGSFIYRGHDLECNLFGHRLGHPLGLAAGFDKNAELVDILGHLGFAFADIGSVTAKPRPGNAKPRIFRLEKDRAIINRLGLNGLGADVVAENLKHVKFSLPLGLNIAKTNDPSIVGDAAVEDIVYTFRKVCTLPLAYVTINASCPNTKEGIVTEAAHLAAVFAEVQKSNTARLPILVKLSPDSSETLIEEVVQAARENQLSGFLCGNTSVSRENLITDSTRLEQIGAGGLSGVPLKSRALRLCKVVAAIKSPSQVLIGCGGVASGADVYEFLKAGASFVQLYSALVFEGPGLPARINKELSAILRERGETLQDLTVANQQSLMRS